MHALKILLVVNTQTYANGSASQYVYMGILNLFVAFLVTLKFLDLGEPQWHENLGRDTIRAPQYDIARLKGLYNLK